LPPLVKLYERYGGEKPTRIDEKNRKIDFRIVGKEHIFFNFYKLKLQETPDKHPV
jgi:hypothetical protein